MYGNPQQCIVIDVQSIAIGVKYSYRIVIGVVINVKSLVTDAKYSYKYSYRCVKYRDKVLLKASL